jgi:hypothetical protein
MLTPISRPISLSWLRVGGAAALDLAISIVMPWCDYVWLDVELSRRGGEGEDRDEQSGGDEKRLGTVGKALEEELEALEWLCGYLDEGRMGSELGKQAGDDHEGLGARTLDRDA